MEKTTITIDLERYEELIKKEALYDQLTAEYIVEPYMRRREEVNGYA